MHGYDIPKAPAIFAKPTRGRVKVESIELEDELKRLSLGVPKTSAERKLLLQQIPELVGLDLRAPRLDGALQTKHGRPFVVGDFSLIGLQDH